MRRSLFLLVLPIAILIMVGGLGCKGDTVASLEPEGVLQGINIFNTPSTMQPGQVHMLGATGLYPGTATYNVTGVATWSTSNMDVIELIGKGILRALSGGTATITVSYKGRSRSVNIEVIGPALPPGPGPTVLSGIRVDPASAALKVGADLQFSAAAVYSNGIEQDITNLVDWHVSDTMPGFIIDSDNANVWGANYGLFRATGPVGTTVVSASYANMTSNYVTVSVRDY
jgi:trimeric autotransporter adhesin